MHASRPLPCAPVSGSPEVSPGHGIPLPAVLGIAVLVGIPLGLAALLFVWVEDSLQGWLWTDLPDALGMGSTPSWWWVLLIPALGGLVVAFAYRLPGRGGHNPARGFNAAPTKPRDLPGAMIAAIATLSCGAVLGPEAPLIALGSAIGLLLARAFARLRAPDALWSTTGSFGAIAAVFGNPLNTSVFMLEAGAAAGGGASLIPGLLPGFVAAGMGFLIFTGVGNWSGIPMFELGIPGLETYDSVSWSHLVAAVVIGVVVALLTAAIRQGAVRLDRAVTTLSPYVVLPAVGLVIGLCAVLFQAGTGRPYDLVLFSGQDGLDNLAAETSAGVVAALVLAKGLAYLVSLGGGFRGGPVFPAMFLGTSVGMVASLILPDLPVTAAVSIGIAAGMAGMLGFVVAAVLFSLLVTGEAGFDATSLAILATAAAWVVRAGLDKAFAARHAPAART